MVNSFDETESNVLTNVNVDHIVDNMMNTTYITESNISYDVSGDPVELSELLPFYKANVNNLKIAHVNINSLRHKFQPLVEVMNKGMLDILSIQETKLDVSFPVAQFSINGYKCYRKDVTCNAGGLIVYVRSDLRQRRLDQLEADYNHIDGRLETLAIEIQLNAEKLIFFSMYKQPKLNNGKFLGLFDDIMMKCSQQVKNIIIVGDLNVNFINSKHCLRDIIDLYGMINIVRKPTCRKGKNASLLDVVLTNVPKRLQNVMHCDLALSDFHDMICFSTKMHVSKRPKTIIKYRSYKKFNLEHFEQELSRLPFHVSDIFDDVDESYWFYEQLINSVINEHAPMKSRTVLHKNVPYMNGELRRAINVRNMLRRRYYKLSSTINWERYRQQRNLVVKLRKKSLNVYIQNKCVGKAGTKEFWNTVKPLISHKNKNSDNNIILNEGGTFVNDVRSVCNVFNDYFVTMTQDIGEDDTIQVEDTVADIVQMYSTHESIKHIKLSAQSVNTFNFKNVSSEYIHKKLLQLNARKATGFDNIPAKLLKLGASVLCYPLQSLINQCISKCKFPNVLKYGEVRPIHKKNDNLRKSNYRPISVLSNVSKLFESVLVDQMTEHFEPMLSPYLSGFRKHHSCQNVLMKFVEDCKLNLDNSKVGGAILTDLSRAFDCLPHRLLTAKLHAYGVSNDACT